MWDLSTLKDFNLPTYWITWFITLYCCIPVVIYFIVPLLFQQGSMGSRKTVSILVLGDLGHSPRMCYHALSFAHLDYTVNLCGYIESEPPAAVLEDINIDVIPIPVVHNRLGLPYLLFAVQKIILQCVSLFLLLMQLRGSTYFLLQNPPAMPLLALLVVFIKVFSPKSKLIIDWHNLNYTILNLKFQNLNHPAVKILKLYERLFSRFAWLNLTVTNKMKHFLIEDFGVFPSKIITLYDRPGPQFVPLSETTLTKKSLLEHDLFSGVDDIEDYKILVTATSFTPDEDFGILLRALKNYHDSKELNTPLFVVVTGKGPLKNSFLSQVEKLQFLKKVIIRNAWLSAEEYPLILAVADLAVSLHTSLSGIDLPMKIVDFFGVGVPVVTLSFPAIDELVKENINGLITRPGYDADSEIFRLISEVVSDEDLLETLKAGALAESKKRWRENWTNSVAKEFTSR